MREIKYRAWVESIGQMDEVIGLNFKKEIADFVNNNERPFYTLDLMQYTGLRDKNGKEIYEGDIFSLGSEKILYVVEWIDVGLRGRQISNRSYVGLEWWKDRIEIVGNIYENPELLGGKNE